MNSLKLLSLLAATAFVALASGCAHVSPDQRGALAHPSMVEELESASMGHVTEVHEGASGGNGVGGGGCGCN